MTVEGLNAPREWYRASGIREVILRMRVEYPIDRWLPEHPIEFGVLIKRIDELDAGEAWTFWSRGVGVGLLPINQTLYLTLSSLNFLFLKENLTGSACRGPTWEWQKPKEETFFPAGTTLLAPTLTQPL